MKKLSLWLPAILMGAVIFLSSQLFDVPKYTPLFAFFAHVKTVAHLVLYFCLGFVLARLLSGTLPIGSLGVLALSSSLCVAYGASDEFHQMFVSGRTANFFDILRDFVGGTLGALVYVACAWVGRCLRTAPSEAPSGIGLMVGQAAVTVVVSVLITVPTIVFSDSIVPFIRSAFLEVRPGGHPSVGDFSGYALAASAGGPGAMTIPAPTVTAGNPTETGSRNVPSTPVSAVNADVVRKAKREMVEEVKNSLLTNVTGDMARYGDRSGMGSMVVSAVETMLKSRPQDGNTASKDAQALVASLSGKNRGASPAPETKTPEVAQETFRPDLLALVVNPANPVNALTTDQVRKVFTGEYTNWSQVGGDDMPITVLLVHAGTRDPGHHPENVLRASPSPNAVTLRYASFIFPRIDRERGAVAFVPISVKAQLGFMEKHETIKLLGLRDRPQSPAVMPSRMAINLGSYPMVVEQSRARLATASPADVSPAR